VLTEKSYQFGKTENKEKQQCTHRTSLPDVAAVAAVAAAAVVVAILHVVQFLRHSAPRASHHSYVPVHSDVRFHNLQG
jgi:hypothetical protein